ncbi:MAG: DEAD/DEAH box helicase family protein [Saprospiraceae bacterium]
MNFSELKLITPLIKALKKKRFYEPTPVQQKAIPHIMQRKHLLVTAEAGMGKTAAYILPIVQMIYRKDSRLNQPPLRAIMVAPNIDMARQIDRNLMTYCKFTNVNHNALWNKGKYEKFLHANRSILVATPEVLQDILKQKLIDTSEVKLLVLDELEQMIPNLQADVEGIIQALPTDVQRLFFISTPTDICKEWAPLHLENAHEIVVTREELAEFKRTAYERKAKRALSKREAQPKRELTPEQQVAAEGKVQKKQMAKLKHIFRNRSEDLPKGLQRKLRWPLG